MKNDFISVCVLGYRRQEMLNRCLLSIKNTLDYPCEIILNLDGGHELALPDPEFYSKLIINNGENRGVGRSFQNCLGLAEGRIVMKVDSDIIFDPQWASTTVALLDKYPKVGALSLFNYQHYDPTDERFQILESRPDYDIVNDFVSSCYAFRADDLWKLMENTPIPDDGMHQEFANNLLLKTRRHLAIPKTDLVKNIGFGRNSVYLQFDEQEQPSKRPTSDIPLIFR